MCILDQCERKTEAAAVLVTCLHFGGFELLVCLQTCEQIWSRLFFDSF